MEGDGHGAASGIYETVRSEVRRAISEIQNDLERVRFSLWIASCHFLFAFLCFSFCFNAVQDFSF